MAATPSAGVRRGPTGDRADGDATGNAVAVGDAQLVPAAQADPRAFAPLYERYVDRVYRYCLRRLGDEDEAADATSLVFTRALAALPRFQPSSREGGSFRAWLFTIAHRVVVDVYRGARPTSPLGEIEAGGQLRDRAATPEEQALARDERARVERALAQLPATQRQIVELRLAGLRGAEIAAVLGLSVPAVKSAHFRAYARLRELLSDERP
jgi:RNA polymerase sigma-70 factor (ECF subfamily)